MTKGLLQLSKQKQKLYKKLVKIRSPRNENICKEYKSLFESLKKILKTIIQDVLENIKTI